MTRIGDGLPPGKIPPPAPDEAREVDPPSTEEATAAGIAEIASALGSLGPAERSDPRSISEAVVDWWIDRNLPKDMLSEQSRRELRETLADALCDDPVLRDLV